MTSATAVPLMSREGDRGQGHYVRSSNRLRFSVQVLLLLLLVLPERLNLLQKPLLRSFLPCSRSAPGCRPNRAAKCSRSQSGGGGGGDCGAADPPAPKEVRK